MEDEIVASDRKSSFLKGIIIPNVAALVLVGASKYVAVMFEQNKDVSSTLVFSNFIIVPVIMGLISAYYWRDLGMKTKQYIAWSLLNSVVSVLLSAIFLREGVFCLMIVSPLVFVFMAPGALIGKVIFRRRNGTLNVSLFGLIVVIFIGDIFSHEVFLGKVADTMIINAPVEKVWPLVVEYEPIQAKEKYWFFKLGMPSPIQSTVNGHETGAERKCIFSNGYVFDEVMTVYKPNEELTFDIVTQPRDPEIMGHIDITRGQFTLVDNGDGTTTLTGTSWYKLYVFPAWYFNAWSESITRNVHLRVMEHIKAHAEKDV
jgi:hypothetical protein